MRKDGEQRAVCVLRDAAAAALLSRESKWAVRSVSLMGRAGTRQAATETLGGQLLGEAWSGGRSVSSDTRLRC